MATERSVSAICNGTVIDHIAAGQALKLVHLLNLMCRYQRVTIGLNLESKTLGYKDLIKVEGRELSAEESAQIAIFAPKASVNIIRDYKVISKGTVSFPDAIYQVLVCPNACCITNVEKVSTRFYTRQSQGPQREAVHLQCHYCEKVFALDEITKYRVES